MNRENSIIEQNWDNASWTGRRRAMIRHTLTLTVRQRLQVLEELCNTSNKLASIKTYKKHSSPI